MRMQGQGVGADTGQTSLEAAGRLFSQAVWHQHHGKPNEAVRLYKQVLALKADHAEAHNNLGCVLLAQGKRDAASACFERALVLVPQLFDDFASVGALLVARSTVTFRTGSGALTGSPAPARDGAGAGGPDNSSGTINTTSTTKIDAPTRRSLTRRSIELVSLERE